MYLLNYFEIKELLCSKISNLYYYKANKMIAWVSSNVICKDLY